MSKEDRAREDSALDFERHDQERAQAFVQSRLDAADKIYSQAINGLILGNSGAALAVLAFVGATWKDGKFPKLQLLPLARFSSLELLRWGWVCYLLCFESAG